MSAPSQAFTQRKTVFLFGSRLRPVGLASAGVGPHEIAAVEAIMSPRNRYEPDEPEAFREIADRVHAEDAS